MEKLKTFYQGHDLIYRHNAAAGHPGWHNDPAEYDRFRNQVQAILAKGHAPPAGRLLDLGCGSGEMAIWFAQLGYSVSGIDISTKAIELAQATADSVKEEIQFVCGNVTQLSTLFQNQQFDFIFDGHCLHCIIGNDRQLVLQQIHSLLRHGGYFQLNTMCQPVGPSITDFDPDSCSIIRQGIATYYIGHKELIMGELRNAGFEIINVEQQPTDEISHTGNLIVECRRK